MLKNSIVLGILTVAFLFINLYPVDANAIPAFARKYKISCTTCHAPIPKLKPYGAEFAGNGFVIPEEEKERDYVTAGDPLLWLNRDFPIAVRFDAYGVYDDKAPVDNDLQIPWGVKLLSGGAIYKNIGYYFYFYLSERGEISGIEDAYIHFNNLFHQEFDIMVGQFQTSDPLMKRELRLTFEDYRLYTQRIGLSNLNLTYDRGIMMTYGIAKTSTDLVGFVVNGSGIGQASEDTRKFDNDTAKNFGFRLLQGFGEIASIGAFYYNGKETLVDSSRENTTNYIGPDVNVVIGKFEFTGQYLLRTDKNPLFIANPEDIKTNSYIAELIFAPQKDASRWYLATLYNRIDSDLEGYDYQTISVSPTYLISRNLRIMAEFTRDTESEANRVVVGLVSAF